MTPMIDRIAKLLNLAGNNPSEAEATAALAKAFALMAEHQIDMGQVQAARAAMEGPAARTGEAEIIRVDTVTKLSEIYWRYLWHACAELNGCTYSYLRQSPVLRTTHHFLVGSKGRVTAAKVMAEYLCEIGKKLAREEVKRQMPRIELSRQLAKSLCGTKPISQARIANSFLHGFSARVYNRLMKMRRDAEEGKLKTADGTRNLPALLSMYQTEKEAQDAWLKANGFIIGKSRKTRAFDIDPDAYEQGRTVGGTVGLDRQITPSGG